MSEANVRSICVNVSVNGRAAALPVGATVDALITNLQLEGKRFAIERNGEIVPKSLVASTPIEEGDTFEVVIAVGGG
jgi:sulfur carrier protein